MIVNNKVIENIGLEDIENMIEDAIGCSNNSSNSFDLKLIFDVNMQLREKINNYRDERVQKFASENEDKYKIIFHAIPIDAFLRTRIDTAKVRSAFRYKKFFTGHFSHDFEGLYNNKGLFKKRLFRNGIFEAILVEYRPEEGVNVNHSYNEFKKFVNESLDIYGELDISCPIVYFITFTNVKGRSMIEGPILNDCERDVLNPTGVIIKDKDQVGIEVENIFVPIWNHFGYDEDYLFDVPEKEGNQ